MKTFKELTAKQKRHLAKMGMRTFKAFKTCHAAQEAMREAEPGIEPCWECRDVANDLGLSIKRRDTKQL